jgi:aerobic-type carbon monoxide dehydrogenase small subunit (CoxS/CutS family)
MTNTHVMKVCSYCHPGQVLFFAKLMLEMCHGLRPLTGTVINDFDDRGN